MKIYNGQRSKQGCTVMIHEASADGRPVRKRLRRRLDLRNHSPTGFEWGYLGSGPAQLALALCADALGDDDKALKVYQKYKQAVVVQLEHAGWSLAAADVKRVAEAMLANLERDKAEVKSSS